MPRYGIQISGTKRSRMVRLAPARLNFKRLVEVRRLQQAEKCLIPKAAVERVTREIMATLKHDIRIKSNAVEAIQVAAEDYLHKLFQQADMLATHAGRKTIKKADMDMATKLEAVRRG
jgi:histone H3